MSTFPPSEVEYEEAHLYQNLQPACYGVISTFFVLALFFVCVRLISRRLHGQKFALDDYLIVAGTIALIPFMAATYGEIKSGIGKHIISLTPADLTMQAKWEVVNLYSYTTCITLIKLSILALLARIFDVENKLLRIAVWILATWMVLWAVALYFAYGFQCQPFSRNWSLTNPCKPSLRLEYSASILNAVHDTLLFLLPQPIIWKLHMPLRKKMTVSVIFFIGFVATLMSILKIAYVQGAPGSAHKIDATYTTVPAVIFNTMEPLLAVICSCLPSSPIFFQHVRIHGFSRLSSLLGSSRFGKSGSQFSTSKKPPSSRSKESERSWPRIPRSQDDNSVHNVYIQKNISTEASHHGSEDIALPSWTPGPRREAETDMV